MQRQAKPLLQRHRSHYLTGVLGKPVIFFFFSSKRPSCLNTSMRSKRFKTLRLVPPLFDLPKLGCLDILNYLFPVDYSLNAP